MCMKCKHNTPIPFSEAGKQGWGIELNQKAVLASKCAGQSYTALKMMFGMMDLPIPVSKIALYCPCRGDS